MNHRRCRNCAHHYEENSISCDDCEPIYINWKPREQVMTSIEKTLQERAKTHGHFESHSRIAQSIKTQIFNAHGYSSLNAVQRESLDMIAHKIARILNGNPNVHDHWHDIAGYAELVRRDLESQHE